MRDLLEFLIKGILGKEKFELEESEEEGRLIYAIKTDPANIGLIIGKEGKVIKALRNLVKVRATLEKKMVSVNISE